MSLYSRGKKMKKENKKYLVIGLILLTLCLFNGLKKEATITQTFEHKELDWTFETTNEYGWYNWETTDDVITLKVWAQSSGTGSSSASIYTYIPEGDIESIEFTVDCTVNAGGDSSASCGGGIMGTQGFSISEHGGSDSKTQTIEIRKFQGEWALYIGANGYLIEGNEIVGKKLSLSAGASADMSASSTLKFSGFEIIYMGEEVCIDTEWWPVTGTVCFEDTFIQTSNCGNTRVETGTKDCIGCIDTEWTPNPDQVCSGELFTQTSNCGNTKAMAGTRDCNGNGNETEDPEEDCEGKCIDIFETCNKETGECELNMTLIYLIGFVGLIFVLIAFKK